MLNHPEFAGSVQRDPRFDDTAMVLADEGLLVPLVSSAGALYNKINITMGYPIQNTPVFSFINQLIDLQKNYRVYGGGDARRGLPQPQDHHARGPGAGRGPAAVAQGAEMIRIGP